MGSSSPDDVTGWLQAWSRGDESALEELVPLVYQVLKVSPQTVLRDWRLARAWLSREMRRGDRNGRRPLEDG